MSEHQEPELSAPKRALIAIRDLTARLEAVERARHEPIAIVGMACRLPGAANVDQYWDLLRDGVDAIRPVPPDRWDAEALYDPDPDAPGKTYCREGGFIEHVDLFDAGFFGIPPREVASMDPQQRLLLEVAWEALEDAGIPPAGLSGSLTGVYVGLGTTDYTEHTIHSDDTTRIDAYFGTGGAPCVAAGRISFVLGLQGPAMTVDTACSSSLVAIDLAVQQLRTGKCRLALAGGVNVILSAKSTVYLSKVRALSPTNRCRSFAADADGYVRGEGCGMLVLKRLSDAERDNDRILALIRGAATNHDGRSSGLTVPNGAAQEAVIRTALADAGLEPSRLQYVEAHGTGTPLGDPIEIHALGAVLSGVRAYPAVVGSVKTNIGHLEAASGVAGIIKIVLAMRRGVIPKTLHFREPSSHVRWQDLPVVVASESMSWPDPSVPLIAGISGYGFSGTNAHIILESAALPVPSADTAGQEGVADRPRHLLTLSAPTHQALVALATEYERCCAAATAPAAADLAFSANTGRSHFDHRAAVVGDSPGQFAEALRAVAADRPHPAVSRGQASVERPRIAFLFTGQGSQYVGMGRELYDTDPTFRRVLEVCDEILRPALDRSILSVIFGTGNADPSLIDQTAFTQPALFATEYALAQMWRAWGIEPTFVMGHSVGEYVAACVSGLFSLEDGLRLIAERGRLMQSLPEGGCMAAVFASEAVVLDAINASPGVLSIAAINGPDHAVISGTEAAVSRLLADLAAAGVRSQKLAVSHAFHSPLMEPILDEFERAVARVSWLTPRVRIVSNVTGAVASVGELATSGYWRQHLRAPVRFSASIAALRANGCRWMLEAGPQPTLLAMAARCEPEAEMLALASLRRGTSDMLQVLKTLGTMYAHGATIDWHAFDSGRRRQKVSLPHYPFQRARHWVDASSARPLVREATAHDAAGHPLLGHRVRSPLLQSHVFESSLPAAELAFVNDHVVYGAVVLPATAYIEMAVAGAREAFGEADVAVESFTIEEALALPDGSVHVVQLALSPLESGRATFQVFSRDVAVTDADAPWTRHAAGDVVRRPEKSAEARDSLAEIRERCSATLDVAAVYERLRGHGVAYGPTFQGMQALWRGTDEAVARLVLPSGLAEESSEYAIHPAFMDAALQVLSAAVSDLDAATPEVYLPVGISRVRFEGPVPQRVWSHARLALHTEHTETVTAELRWFDDAGRLVWEATGVTMKRATRQSLQRAGERQLEDWLYEIEWQPSEPAVASQVARGTWLLLADESGWAVRLASELRARGASPLLVRPGVSFARTGDGYTVDPTCREHFDEMMKDATSAAALEGVVHLWGLDARDEAYDADRLDAAVARGCGSLALLVQALASRPVADSAPRLSVVTRGAVAVGLAPWPVQVAQAPLWGLARTVSVEQPQLQCTVIDIDPGEELAAVDPIAVEVLAPGDENQVALRAGARFVARLVRKRRGHAGERRLTLPPGDSFELTTTSRGVLDNLCFVATPRRAPAPTEVEVRVHSAGLNFRDVLNALGMYPGDPGPMGGECAGRVTAVGSEVSDIQIGDDVVCLAGGSFGRYVITPREAVVHLPERLTYEQGAGIPVTFLTAHYGLHELARIKPGDRVLVHAAAGGVGQAAVQLALRAGAEVYGTAGSREKRDFVRALGVRHVFDSRVADFRADVMALSGGRGVDIVLNSLTGAFIPESLKVLKPGGHFLEIGKAEIWTAEAIAAVNPAAFYRPFDLGDVMMHERGKIASMFEDIMTGLEEGVLRPLPTRVFDIRDALAAFRFMAQAKHVGKIVLSQRDVLAEEPGIAAGLDDNATYLVTGGTGGLGLKVAEWLVSRNARHVVLTGRAAPSPEATGVIETLIAAGAQVTVARGDVAHEPDVRRLLQDIAATPHPLRGIVHAAGVLDDGMLSELTLPRFQTVMAPKVRGGWLLHDLTQRQRLDFFVLFSSTSAVFGAPGQANYAAANAFLDGLAHYRCARGLPALSVNWGAWSEVGMATRLQGRNQTRIADRGIAVIPPDQGVRALGLLVHQPAARVTVLPVRWPTFLDTYPGAVPPLLRVLARVTTHRRETAGRSEAAGGNLKAQLAAVPEAEREALLVTFLREQVAKVLGLDDGEALAAHVPFTNLGLDSLMAVELRNAVASAMGQSLPASLTFDYPTMERLAAFMGTHLIAPAAVEARVAVAEQEAHKWAKVSEQLDQLSDDQMATLLASQLAALGSAEGEQ
jgi:myxalamid-type polyketide synthase MxaB